MFYTERVVVVWNNLEHDIMVLGHYSEGPVFPRK